MFVESIKGTVLLMKELYWNVQQEISVDNASIFLSSFIVLGEVEIVSSQLQTSFRFTDDWFKLFEALALYRVALHIVRGPACTASMETLISFLFSPSSAPCSKNRLLHTAVEWNKSKTLRSAAERLIEVSFLLTLLPHPLLAQLCALEGHKGTPR